MLATVNDLPAGGLPSGTRRTVNCARCNGPKATKHVLITRANGASTAHVFEKRKRRAIHPPA
jgi:hypothetical protein